MPEQQEHNFLPSPEHIPTQDTGDFMKNLEQGGLDRGQPKINLNDMGVDKAGQERAQIHREIHEQDKIEGNIHTEAGIPLPLKAKDDKQAVDLINKIIDSGSTDPSDQISILDQNYKM